LSEVQNKEAILAIRVQPRSSRNRLAAQPDGTLKAWLTASPVEGAANRALIEILAEYLGVPRSRIQIASGESSRNKRVRVAGMSTAEVDSRLAQAGKAARVRPDNSST